MGRISQAPPRESGAKPPLRSSQRSEIKRGVGIPKFRAKECQFSGSVYGYPEVVGFLQDELRRRQKKNPRFSIRAWARQAGLSSPSTLVNILNRKRRLGTRIAAKISKTLKLSHEEQVYFDTLVLKHNAKSIQESELFNANLKRLRPDPERCELELQYFLVIAEWHHFAILELINTVTFSSSHKEIASRLRNKIDPESARIAIARLQKLGLIEKRSTGGLARMKINPVVNPEIPSSVIQSHHRQLLHLAEDALEEQTLAERDFRSTQFVLTRATLGAAKKAVREFHRTMQQLTASSEGEAVYAFNTQLFNLTDVVISC